MLISKDENQIKKFADPDVEMLEPSQKFSTLLRPDKFLNCIDQDSANASEIDIDSSVDCSYFLPAGAEVVCPWLRKLKNN